MSENQTRMNLRYLLIGALCLIVLVVGVAYGLMRKPDTAPITVVPPPPTPLPTTAPTPGPVRVYVSGAVLSPGVYTLPAGSSAAEAIDAAGGPTDEADLASVNLAQAVQDQEQLHVPLVRAGQPDSPDAPQTDGAVNINTADSQTLQTLPGIGPAMAERIISYRQENGSFATVDDLVNVKGIGPATLEKLRDLITVQ